ncbi:hypothetical protein [Methanoplanus endosymbiosus]|uniref:Uncharacterized protein n=1 Tax=Methanoplanus endosymbiosus TaxID=33865 RepID=A0A9E7PMK8_9EURY|nr:hypothetical protein [Methanoplanus endosymbiosus]UUX92635.1 hypothetical protein L6E24_00470 [Methanoplanus endosymbiosus]
MEELGVYNDFIETIQYENITSTYNFSLIISAINTVQDFSGEGSNILETNRRAYPFSCLIAYFIQNYYSILSEEEFIPQKPGETKYSNSKQKLALREYMNPVIYYYQDNNKKEDFYKNLRTNFVPTAIQAEWKLMVEKTGKLIVSELMKDFGSSKYDYNYPFLKPEINILSENYEYTSCSYQLKYFSIPDELNNIFINNKLSSEIKDIVYKLWTYYTSDLKQNLNRENFESLLRKTTESSKSEKDELFSSRTEDIISIPIENPKFKSLDPEYLFNPPDNLFANINENIAIKYAYLSEKNKELNCLNAEIELYNRFLDEDYNNLADIPEKYNISGTETEEKIKNIDQILNFKSEIDKLSKENKTLNNKLRNNQNSEEINKDNLELIKEINEDIKQIESLLNFKSKPFAYTNEPVKRFLTYSGELAEEILYSSLSLLANKNNSVGLSNNYGILPTQFIKGYEKWIDQKEGKSNREDGKITRNNNPTVIYNKIHGDIRLLIPQQIFNTESDSDYIQFLVYDNRGFLCEKKSPIYEYDDVSKTDEVQIILNRPSENYSIEMLAGKQCIKQFRIIFLKNGYAAFSYDNLKLVKSKVKSGLNYILSKNKIEIKPEEAIIEQGKYYGEWTGYTYHLVDFDDFKVEIGSELTGETSEKDLVVDLHGYEQLSSILINGKPVIIKTLPKVSIKYKDLNLLYETVISIHPSGNTKIENAKIINLKQYFTDNQYNLPLNGEINIDLSNEVFICKNSVSAYIIRIRNKKCRTDQRFEFTFVPSFDMKYDQLEYFSKNPDDVVKIDIVSMPDLKLEFDDSVSVNYINKEHLNIIFPVRDFISGKIKFNDYAGDLSIEIPILSWRFENPDNSYIGPKYTSFKEISEEEFYSIGDHKILSLFPSHLDENPGYLVIDPINEVIPSNPNEGKIPFNIFKYLYKINLVTESLIKFSYLKNKGHITNEINLFNLNRWEVKNLDWDVSENSSERIISLKWEEKYDVPEKNIIIWKAGINETKPQVIEHKIISKDEKETEFRINKSRFTQGIYYIQFIAVFDEWQPQIPKFPGEQQIFPGEQQINVFQRTFKLEGKEILEEADILLENGKYLEAIEEYRGIEKLNPEIRGLWKQKIQNRLIYTHKFSDALDILALIFNNSTFGNMDKTYATQLMFVNILPLNEYLSGAEYIKIFNITILMLSNNDNTQRKIISSKKETVARSIENCNNLDEEERKKLHTSFKELYSRL